jgi:RNA polymerase sigma-70 factor (ECF subfamily)
VLLNVFIEGSLEEPILQKMNDTQLLEGYRSSGDNRYFQEIFGRYERRIQSLCLKFFHGNRTQAEDAKQDTFLKALQRASQDTIYNVGSWLLIVARNSCIDIHRKERASIFESHSETDPDLVGVNQETPQTETRLQELIDRINELGQKQRLCLKLYLEGYTYQEIARITHYSEKEIKSAIQTGKENLRNRFQKQISKQSKIF